MPLSTTLASEHIFNVFSSPDKTDALLHGHSYTAHPIGCQVALESVTEMQEMEKRGDWDWAKSQGWQAASSATTTTSTSAIATKQDSSDVWSIWPRHFVEDLSRQTDRVSGVWALGNVLAIHMRDSAGTGYNSNAALGLRESLSIGKEGGDGGPWNVHSRVLGNVLYVMSSQTTSETSIKQLSELLLESIRG